ncbi:MAG TPA: flagellar hook assembly protein FlgD [Stellaceae bacterium]|nr:flagellar hook assembly protein FlgD [Stellaceae bacterium]
MTASIGSNTPTPAPTTSGQTTSAAQATLGSDLNTFLKLLTTQLQNQDPESPLDTNQFTQQLVSFSQVEQAINTNTKLDNLIALQSADQSVAALPLVGHTVQFSDNKLPLVDGSAQFAYTLPSQASQAVITVSDASGKIVFQGQGDTAAGAHTFSWDGHGSDGGQLPDGTYTFNVSATASDGSAITATDTSFGKVDSVQFSNGTTSVRINGVSEPLGKIVAITS